MAKLMIVVDVPDVSYNKLRRAMLEHRDIGGVSFEKKGTVTISSYIIEEARQKDIPAYDPSTYEFGIIGVRP